MRARFGRAVAIAAVLGLVAVLPAARGAESGLPRLGPAPNFALTTQQNDRLWLTQLRERVVVLTFTCTTCAACPGLLPALVGLSRALGDAAGRRVFFVAVSVDPARDTAPVLRRFAHERGLDPTAWLLLTGTPAEVAVVTRRYGLAVRRPQGGVTHDCVVVLIDGAGLIRGRYRTEDLGRLRPDLEGLLSQSVGS
ncbi:MAG: SCO family protein [Candidatus Rokubacteria bacterium]|nr:SCO family protein [Candidatus Rokubacteria bacterium]